MLKSAGLFAALCAGGIWRAGPASATGGGNERGSEAAPHGSAPDRPSAREGILLEVPGTVEDGFHVPVTVESRIPGTREIRIVVDGNPIPLAASFAIPTGTDAYVSTRIKMAGSGSVRAEVLAGGRVYAKSVETRVTVGGCS
jgi:sulfur-oxidizing protein SoxY